jgi:hypothetical protein
VEYAALKLVQPGTRVGLTRPFLRCDRKRVAHVAFASGEIQKSRNTNRETHSRLIHLNLTISNSNHLHHLKLRYKVQRTYDYLVMLD